MEAVGVGRRAVAIIIDSILLAILAWIFAAASGGTTEEGMHLSGAPFFLFTLIALGYFVVMEKTSGATIGKKVMGLKVVKEDGQPLDWAASIIRNLLRLIDGQLLYLVAAVCVWVSKDKKRLGDMAAKTLVVRAGS